MVFVGQVYLKTCQMGDQPVAPTALFVIPRSI
jgi:hypothetical protein